MPCIPLKADVSEGCVAPILKVEGESGKKTNVAGGKRRISFNFGNRSDMFLRNVG
jgi:hypothetical protein